MKLRTLIIALLSAPLVLCAAPNDSLALAIGTRLDSLVAAYPVLTDRTQIGMYVYDLTADSALYARGHHYQMRPASTQKVVTAVAALNKLGGRHTFATRLYAATDSLAADSSAWYGKIVVRGGMDPRLDGSDLTAMAKALRTLGSDTLRGDLVLDMSFKDSVQWGWGWCWDDKACPLIALTYNEKDGFEEAFMQALERQGLTLQGRVVRTWQRAESTHAALRLLCERRATIDQVLERMMKRSNNHFAESLFYQLGSSSTRAIKSVEAFLASIGVDMHCVQVADGSGLSLYNYTTPETLVRVLRYAYQHSDIYAHLKPAMPIAGYDGTLKSRMTNTAAAGHVFAKTGTVEGVSSLTGYAEASNGHMLAFAIINQGVRHSSSGRQFQNEVCQALCAPLLFKSHADDTGEELSAHDGADADGVSVEAGQGSTVVGE